MDSLSKQFEAIYDQYIEKIYRFVYLKVNSQEVAQDITSKVFTKGWEALSNSKTDIRNPGAFLYQIARNAVVDHYREKGRVNMVSVDFDKQIADPGTGIYDKAVLAADVKIVKSAILKIKKDYQDIIIWHYLEDMPIDEIAKLVNKPSGTVRVALHRGLKELRGIIEES
jgi:RNA polymerase sigma-70 factor (ECF subfamily)